jgi:hypothetical protein
VQRGVDEGEVLEESVLLTSVPALLPPPPPPPKPLLALPPGGVWRGRFASGVCTATWSAMASNFAGVRAKGSAAFARSSLHSQLSRQPLFITRAFSNDWFYVNE